MSDSAEEEVKQRAKLGGMEEVDYEHDELITVCQDCDFARHWVTDHYSPDTPHGEDLGVDHHAETDHALVQIVPAEDFDREKWPMVARAMETEPSRVKELADVEDIDVDELFEQAYDMSVGGRS